MKTILFLISKKSKKRLIIDYSKLNNVIITDSMLLSLVQDILDQLKKKEYFSKFDIKDVFN